jgi:hypothetical protein
MTEEKKRTEEEIWEDILKFYRKCSESWEMRQINRLEVAGNFMFYAALMHSLELTDMLLPLMKAGLSAHVELAERDKVAN